MKKLFLFVLLFIAFGSAFSQTGNDTTKYLRYYEYGIRHQRIWGDSVVNIPSDTLASKWGLARKGQNLFLGNGIVWTNVTGTGGGGGVTSYIGRTGVVTALSADYSSFYPQLSVAYSDPTWINSLSASKISSPGSVSAGSSKVTLGGVPTGASLQNFSIDVVPANILLSTLGGALGISQISATGSPSSSTFLRGDGTWSSASGGGITSSNIGTGYRWVIPFTGSTKTLFTQSYLLADSSTNTNGLTIGADTSAGKLATKTDIINIAPYTASNGLTKVGLDFQLGGRLSKSDTIIIPASSSVLNIIDSGTSAGNYGLQFVNKGSATHQLLFLGNSSAETNTMTTVQNLGTGKALDIQTINSAGTNSTVTIGGNQTGATFGSLSVSNSAGSIAISGSTTGYTGGPNLVTTGAISSSTSTSKNLAGFSAVINNSSIGDTAYGLIMKRIPLNNQSTNNDIGIASFLNSTGGGSGQKLASLVRTRTTDTATATFTAQYRIGLVNLGSTATADQFILSGSGKLQLPKYGIGSFLGLKAYALAVDASGNIIEDTTAGGGGGGGGASLPFFDNTALIKNITDPTKLLILGAANIATGTTRTIQSPNANGTITLDNNTTTLTNKTIDAGSNTITNLTNSNLSGSAAISNANLATFPGHTRLGNITGGTAAPTYVTQAQETADLNLFTTSTQGLVPASTGGTINFLRADGTWTQAYQPSDTLTTLATRYFILNLRDTIRTGHSGTSPIWGAYVNATFDTLISKSFDPTFFKTKADSTISIDTSAGLTHLATQGYVGSHGGGGGTVADSVQPYTSGTTLTQATLANIIQLNPASVQSTLTITTATSANWAASNDLYITAGGTVTGGNPVITTLTISAGAGLTLVQSVTPTTINAGEVIRYHKIGTFIYRWN